MTLRPPSDNNAFHFPVSVKGVVIREGKVILLRNERDEWELPGGKHKELRWFPLAEIDALNMPEGYKSSIRSWSARMAVTD